jgi:hydroxyquinol 1,2-dioxygenase
MRSANRSADKDNITQAFIDYMGDDTDERGRFLLARLVDHLNDFVKETRLTQSEWRKVIELLVAAGEISDSARNEFVLFV